MRTSEASELRQQGAIDAARDDRSFVTAADAEREMLEESKRAGSEAYQFDPNATPEQKAAQARSHIPPGFHHPRHHKAAAIVTDVDLDKNAVKYDLPSPTQGAALVDQSAPTTNGDAAKINRQWTADETAQWVSKTGWAPRFGGGDNADSQGPTLLDHQTWVESKLDDKFFGDWYHNTAIIAFACLSSWFVAVLGGGLGWVMIILAICATYYRTSIRRVRRNFRDDIERELAKTKLETDVESLEWINSFLVKFWPIYQPVLAQTVINSVDQVLSTATPAFLDSLRLKFFTLGSKPPRMNHVRTYPKAEDDIVLMDWKFSFTPNDVEDLTARQMKNKINPKVVLEVRVGKAMVSHGLDVIVEDMAFSGLIRLKVKLQIPFPHVERIEFCFLEEPTIDYVCKPLGGDMLGFDINFVPGLETFIQSQIHANLSPIMYAPNVFPIEVAKILSGDALDQAIGVLAVTLHGAQGLRNPDKFSGTPDPYVVLSLNGKDALVQSQIVKESASPRWNETKEIILTSLRDTLTLQVFDYNEFRKDKALGTASFSLESLEKDGEQENLQLEVLVGGKARGVIQADFRFFPVLEGRKLDDGTVEPPPESNTGIAKFTVEQAKELDSSKSMVGQLNPYAVLLLNGREVHITNKLKRTNNPIWPNPSKEFLITDRRSAKLGVVIKDDRDLTTDPILGTYQVRLDDMLRLMDKGQEWYHLAGAKSGRAKMTLQWRPVAMKGVLGGSGGYITPIGVMRLHFHSGRGLRNLETVGKSDPYVKVLLSGVEKARTVTFRNNLDPEWDEVHYVPMHSDRERITIEVLDEENMGRDRSLGQVEVAAADYIRQDANGEYLVHGERRLQSDGLRIQGRGAAKGTLNYTVAFYPCLNVADPEEEGVGNEEQQRASIEGGANEDGVSGKSAEDRKTSETDPTLLHKMAEGEKDQSETTEEKRPPKIYLKPEDLVKYESGLVVFKLIEGDFAQSNCRVEVLMDDMRFPSYASSKTKSRRHRFDETGDAFVREIDVSRITVRLTGKDDHKGDDKQDHVIAKISGDTLTTLGQCLNKPTVLTLKDPEGGISQLTVSLRYIPVKMKLDPRESINNMGNIRVDVLEANDLPAADRNGFSDPYCKFLLNGKEIFKSAEQKKTLNPVWRQYFETAIPSRIGADFKVMVYDQDTIGNDDFLGAADINLEMLEPMIPKEYKLPLDGKSGTIRLKILFRPEYVTRARQGSSTFSGTLAAPRKVATTVGTAPIKGVTKGASFLKDGLLGKKKDKDRGRSESPDVQGSSPMSNNNNNQSGYLAIDPLRQAPVMNGQGQSPGTTPSKTQSPIMSMASPPQHNRAISMGGRSVTSVAGGGSGQGGSAPTGTATFTVIAAMGYPPEIKLRVYLKQLTSKGPKEIHKTKSVPSPASGPVQWDSSETCKVSCTPDTQFQVAVKHHTTFQNMGLGETLVFVDDSVPGGSEKTIKVGNGTVVLRTSFTPAADSSTTATTTSSTGNNSPVIGGGSSGFRRSVMPRGSPAASSS